MRTQQNVTCQLSQPLYKERKMKHTGTAVPSVEFSIFSLVCLNKALCRCTMLLLFQCDTCEAVYHMTCKTEFVPCPKCQRLMERNIHLGKRPERSSTDYALAPIQMDPGEGLAEADPMEGTSH